MLYSQSINQSVSQSANEIMLLSVHDQYSKCTMDHYLLLTEGLFTRQKRRNGSGRNEYQLQQNLTVYTCKFCKGTHKKMARSSENRGTDKDRLQFVFFETGTDRARDMKLQGPVRMHLRPYLKRQWMNPSYYIFVSLRKKRTRTSSTNNVSDNSGKCF